MEKSLALFIPKIFKRLWIELFLSLLNEFVQVMIGLLIKEKHSRCPKVYSVGLMMVLTRKFFFANLNVVTNSSFSGTCCQYSKLTKNVRKSYFISINESAYNNFNESGTTKRIH